MAKKRKVTKFKVTGVKKLKGRLGQVGKKYPDEARAALYQEGEDIQSASFPLVPKDEGTLRGSGYTTQPFGRRTIRVVVGYGNKVSNKYAKIQHENLSYRHTDGQAKYLEQPFQKAKRGMLDRIAKRIASSVAGSFNAET
jgi:hypothetical protein